MSFYMQNNPWGYTVNINDDQVRMLYNKYKQKKGIPEWVPLSDAERFEFERAFSKMINSKSSVVSDTST